MLPVCGIDMEIASAHTNWATYIVGMELVDGSNVLMCSILLGPLGGRWF